MKNNYKKIEQLQIQHDDIKALERTFYLFVGMESDEFSVKFCKDNEIFPSSSPTHVNAPCKCILLDGVESDNVFR